MGVPRKYRECEVCLSLLVPQREWNAASPGERDEMAAEGYRKQGVGSRCARDSHRASRANPDKPRSVQIVSLAALGGRGAYLRLWTDGTVTWEAS